MPKNTNKKKTTQRGHRKKSPTTKAGKYVREEMHHLRKGKHKLKSKKQAIAVGLSKARQSGVKVPSKKSTKSTKSTKTKRSKDNSNFASLKEVAAKGIQKLKEAAQIAVRPRQRKRGQ